MTQCDSNTNCGAWIMLFGLALWPASAHCQDRVIVTDQMRCADCEIRLVEEAVLRGPHVDLTFVVSKGTHGYYLASRRTAPGQVVVFDSTGEESDLIGRRGSGPGEYQYVRAVVPVAKDSIAIFDEMNRRITLLDSAYNVARTLPLAVRLEERGALLLPDGTWVLAGQVPTPERFGYPLHRVDEEGKLTSSFELAAVRSATVMVPAAHIARLVNGKIWSVPFHEYVFYEWEGSTDTPRRFVRQADWFRPLGEPSPSPTIDEREVYAEPPPSRITDFQSAGPGRFWVIVHTISQKDWRDARKTADMPDPVPLIETVIELVDLTRKRVITRHRFTQYVIGFLDGDTVFGYREDESGEPEIPVWRVNLSSTRR